MATDISDFAADSSSSSSHCSRCSVAAGRRGCRHRKPRRHCRRCCAVTSPGRRCSRASRPLTIASTPTPAASARRSATARPSVARRVGSPLTYSSAESGACCRCLLLLSGGCSMVPEQLQNDTAQPRNQPEPPRKVMICTNSRLLQRKLIYLCRLGTNWHEKEV
ncbi:uncharacterized protein LOC121774686 isoform X2 [Salvia splendens]|uniref:uncharacterized protein LOC121774686 isoform X2 n=1 Tax=Salvia splendens TaxID=180675 RepID=UPI001C27DBF0|nr:uncharacterized protein LOC121774686 isoform X2 [Salvia splendens]